MPATTQSPVAPGLFTWPSDAPQLIGSRCRDCGVMTFPAQPDCPGCTGDGMEETLFDRRGTLWAAVNTQNRLATVDNNGTVSVIAEGPPLDGPSSFAFGTGHGDKKTLYVTNFAIVSVLTGQPAHPAILSLPAQVPGLALP